MQEKIEINLSLLFKNLVSLEQYFILYCVYRELQSNLEQYCIKYGTFDKKVFKQLEEKGYLFPIDSEITYESLKLTEKYYNDFELVNELDYDKLFNELRDIYPKKVKGRAALQTDLAKCKKKYRDICSSLEKHKLVLECTKLYINDLTKAGKLEFIQALPAYLNQRTYEGYEDEVKKGILEEKPNYDAI